MEIRDGLCFDDVLLVPSYSEITSRTQVKTHVSLPKDFAFSHPIIPANMKTITGAQMAKCLVKLGGLAILHRFMPIEEQVEIVKLLLNTYGGAYEAKNYLGISIGVKPEDIGNVHKLVDAGAKIICIDIAHGDSKMCLEMCEYISKKFPKLLLIAGNVATAEGAKRLWDAGADVVKVGIGPGSLCSTRIETGNGVPQLTALMNVARCRDAYSATHPQRKVSMIADGGIRNSGDIVKSLCFADMVMAGNLFAGAEETPGEILEVDGSLYKEYIGSSTHKTNHIEGVRAKVPVKGKTQDIINKLLEGVRSGVSYQGCSNLDELKDNPEFIRITNAALKESHPHVNG